VWLIQAAIAVNENERRLQEGRGYFDPEPEDEKGYAAVVEF
jgi:5-formyltetrahydrofolate cyclo-ligase